jgi:hypothetical protein
VQCETYIVYYTTIGTVVSIMQKEELLQWIHVYDQETSQSDARIEQELRQRFQSNQNMTKQDLQHVIEWKFSGRLQGRRKRVLQLIEDLDETFIHELSALVFKYENDEIRLKLLTTIRGIGNALSSVILAFYDPHHYGVLDIHAWRELFHEPEPYDIFVSYKQAIRFLQRLREISSNTGLSCRDIEKAYFMKNMKTTRS